MGKFVFSVDLEGEWGARTPRYPGRKDPARRECAWLLEAARKTDTVLTVAAVGHLYMHSCNGHPKLSQAVLATDPKSNAVDAPGHYMPELLQEFKDAGHELAVHSFVHTPYQSLSEQEAGLDVRASVLAASRLGVKPKTFIFPRNSIAHLPLLAKHGFTHYASSTPPRHVLLNYRSLSLHIPQPAEELRTGLVDVPRTWYFDRVTARDQVKLRGLFAQARALNQSVHAWTHPWNLKSERFASHLEGIFRAAKTTGLQSTPMGSIKPKKGGKSHEQYTNPYIKDKNEVF